jgi:hypothetical protein
MHKDPGARGHLVVIAVKPDFAVLEKSLPSRTLGLVDLPSDPFANGRIPRAGKGVGLKLAEKLRNHHPGILRSGLGFFLLAIKVHFKKNWGADSLSSLPTTMESESSFHT